MDKNGQSSRMVGRAVLLLAVRLTALLLVALAIWLVIRALTEVNAFPPNTMWTMLGLFPVSLACLVLVLRFYRDEGRTVRDALGIRKGRIGPDLLWGLLWLTVLAIPFMAGVAGTVYAMYGNNAPEAFATVFFDPSTVVPLDPLPLLALSVMGVVPFMLINAPTEELVFRGYALEAITSRWGAVAGVWATSIFFGAQHLVFAASVPGMLVFFVAFTLWGLCAAIIVHKQGRLVPMVIAHWMVNVMMSSPAIIFPILQLAGVPVSC